MTTFVDTNIFIYFATGVDKAKHARCETLLTKVELQEEELVTSELVIAEVVWFLQRNSLMTRDQIREFMLPLIELPTLRVPRKQMWPRVFDLYCSTRAGFTDAYNAAWMERARIERLYSYDKDFDAIKTVERVEP
jgi:predicted nucleic acid-binding protein